MSAAGFASRNRAQRPLPPPRNAKAAERARKTGEPLVVSFIGDTPWSNPTVYCDSGQRYDWALANGLHAVIVARPGVDIRHAAASILAGSDVLGSGYPVLVDVESQEVACVVDTARGVDFMQFRRESDVWQHYFAPQP